jgi:protein-disulfide isomerase
MLKREHAVLILVALFIGGYLYGRMSAPEPGPVTAAVPAAVAPEAVAETPASPAPAIASATPPSPAPANAAPTSAPQNPAPQNPAPQNNAPTDPNQVWRVTIHPDDMKKGPDSALVKVVVFGAFGNQETADFAPVLDDIVKTYGDKIQLRFKHKAVPLPHPDSIMASEAALAAGAQGKFWPFFDKAMKTNAIGRASLESIAQDLGCDMARFKKDLDSEKYRGQVMRDSLVAGEVAANTYPNALVNGVRLNTPKTGERLKTLIDEQLVKAQAKVKAGTPVAQLYETLIKEGKVFDQTAGPAIKVATEGSPFLGSKTAKVEVEVYEDFQCPFCAKIAPSIHEFAKRFPNDVRIVYKHMPLDIHDHAKLAAEASMAAMAQGKFWEYHDILFANQQALDRPDLEKYAGQAGLDVARFKKDLDAGVGKALIARDTQEGQSNGVSGTPSVFINGMKYQGPRGYPPEGLEAVARVYFGLGK